MPPFSCQIPLASQHLVENNKFSYDMQGGAHDMVHQEDQATKSRKRRPSVGRVTRSVRLSQDLADKLDSFVWGQGPMEIEAALRAHWNMPSSDVSVD